MAVILVLDAVNTGKGRLPKVLAVTCDGYTLYAEKEMERGVRSEMHAAMNEDSIRRMAQTLLEEESRPLGLKLACELRAELRELAEKARKEEEEKTGDT